MASNKSIPKDYELFPVDDGILYSEFSLDNLSSFLENIREVHEVHSESIAIYGIVLTILSFLLNTIILVVIFSSERLKHNMVYQCFSNMCIVNLVTCFTVNPISIYSEISAAFNLGHLLCKCWIYLDLFLPFVGILVLCGTTADRVILTYFPLLYARTIDRMNRFSQYILPWILAAVILFPVLITGSLSTSHVPGYCILAFDNTASILIPILSFFSPSILLILCMIFTLIGNFRVNERVTGEQNLRSISTRSSGTRASISQPEPEYQEISLVMLYISNSLFVVLWFPHQFVSLLLTFCHTCSPPYAIIVGFAWLGASTMIVVPLIWLFDSKLRERFLDLKVLLLQHKPVPIEDDEGTEVQLMEL